MLPEEIRGLRLPGDGRDDGVERGQAQAVSQERTGKRARGILADNHREGLGEVVGVRERDEHARAALADQ